MKLKEYLKNTTYQQAALEIGTSSVNVHRWATGKSIPDRFYMVKIAEWSKGKVQPNDFYFDKDLGTEDDSRN